MKKITIAKSDARIRGLASLYVCYLTSFIERMFYLMMTGPNTGGHWHKIGRLSLGGPTAPTIFSAHSRVGPFQNNIMRGSTFSKLQRRDARMGNRGFPILLMRC